MSELGKIILIRIMLETYVSKFGMKSSSNKYLSSATVADWERKIKDIFTSPPSQSALASLRIYQIWKSRGMLRWLLCKNAVMRHRIWSIVTGGDLPINSEIVGGLLMHHPNGIVIHPTLKTGPNCLIFAQVTLGTNELNTRSGVPTLGGHVDVGAGAKIGGPQVVGDNAMMDANAAVLTDLPIEKCLD